MTSLRSCRSKWRWSPETIYQLKQIDDFPIQHSSSNSSSPCFRLSELLISDLSLIAGEHRPSWQIPDGNRWFCVQVNCIVFILKLIAVIRSNTCIMQTKCFYKSLLPAWYRKYLNACSYECQKSPNRALLNHLILTIINHCQLPRGLSNQCLIQELSIHNAQYGFLLFLCLSWCAAIQFHVRIWPRSFQNRGVFVHE